MLILTWIFRNGDWWWLFDVPVWYESVRCGQVFEHSIAGGGSRHQKKHRTLPALMWGDLVEASSWSPGHQRFGETWRSEHVFFFGGGHFSQGIPWNTVPWRYTLQIASAAQARADVESVAGSTVGAQSIVTLLVAKSHGRMGWWWDVPNRKIIEVENPQETRYSK